MEYELGPRAYQLALDLKKRSYETQKAGKKEDLNFLHDDLWLQDCVVFDQVIKLSGIWQISLIFVHYKTPLLLIKRFIKNQISQRRAEVDGKYMRRLAAKDQRGTIKLETQLNICVN